MEGGFHRAGWHNQHVCASGDRRGRGEGDAEYKDHPKAVDEKIGGGAFCGRGLQASIIAGGGRGSEAAHTGEGRSREDATHTGR